MARQPTDANAKAEAARSLLRMGYSDERVAERTGLSPEAVAEIAATVERPDVGALATAMRERLDDLGISMLAASKMGRLSRTIMAMLGRDGKGVTPGTLVKLDDILSWERGSAEAVMWGGKPTPREGPAELQPPPPPDSAAYERLGREIEKRLRELNLSKSKWAAIGGPPRSTLSLLGKRGFHAAADTLARIDRFLLWEPGSAEAVLRGGLPIRIGPTPASAPSIVPLNAALDRQRRLLAQLDRIEKSVAQLRTEVTESISHITVALGYLEDMHWYGPPTEYLEAAIAGAASRDHAADQDRSSTA